MNAALGAAVAVAMMAVGCGVAGSETGRGTAPPEITVLAASSLTEAFEALADDFERETDVTVRFSFASSSTLARQITDGAPADVFASAAPEQMAGLPVAAEPAVFARNRLQIAVPEGNPGGVRGLKDFERTDLVLAVCVEDAPCGAAAQQAFDSAGVTPRPDTLAPHVKAVLAAVRLGEVDAGLVYRTDVLAAAADVDPVDPGVRVATDYPIAVLADAPHSDEAKAFVAFVRSPAGTERLVEHGFETP